MTDCRRIVVGAFGELSRGARPYEIVDPLVGKLAFLRLVERHPRGLNVFDVIEEEP